MLHLEKSGEGLYTLFGGGGPPVRIRVRRNPFHAQNCYLELQPPDAAAFPPQAAVLLYRALGCPLQVMAAPGDPIVPALLAGGFARRRRCYILEARPADWKRPPEGLVPLEACRRGTPLFDRCCALQYRHYRTTHAAVSPLTADPEAFCRVLPGQAFCREAGGQLLACVFVEENEIAYLAARTPAEVPAFAQSLAAGLYRRFASVCFECDDCDPAAMALMDLVTAAPAAVADTWIFDGRPPTA